MADSLWHFTLNKSYFIRNKFSNGELVTKHAFNDLPALHNATIRNGKSFKELINHRRELIESLRLNDNDYRFRRIT